MSALKSNKLLINLFSAYKVCDDDVFRRYIEDKESQYDDGVQINATELMQVAFTKYQTRMDSNEWQALSAEQERLLALEDKLKGQEL